MDTTDWKEQEAISLEHCECPAVGDYWEDLFCPVALVVEVSDFSVSLLRKRVPVDAGHWTFDTDKVETMSRTEFRRWLSYGRTPGTWANVHPNWEHAQTFIEEAKDRVK